MAVINVLDKNTINQIAAGEVVERPKSIVKELVENAIDAGATAVTVEVKNGGIDLVRVTDNGCGIEHSEIRKAFLRHATSKIEKAEDLSSIMSLGFRGEALSSIAAVTELEMITKRHEDLTGTSYEIAGGEERKMEEIGAPDGTTFLVRNLFYNTPVRRKFLKSAMTEMSYIADLMERMALSHPEVSLRFIANGSTRLVTSGNGKVKDLIYTIYGRETANELTEIRYDDGHLKITGYLGKPVIAKGNRGFENYFINGRYVKSNLITKAIEEAYAPFMMQHRYPFTVLYIELPAEEFDVNVHPTKMELRFQKEALLYDTMLKAVREALEHKEFIPDIQLDEKEKSGDAKSAKAEEKIYRAPEPFEKKRMEAEKPVGLRPLKSQREPVMPEIKVPVETQRSEVRGAAEQRTAAGQKVDATKSASVEQKKTAQPEEKLSLREQIARKAALRMAEEEDELVAMPEDAEKITAMPDEAVLPFKETEKPVVREENNYISRLKEEVLPISEEKAVSSTVDMQEELIPITEPAQVPVKPEKKIEIVSDVPTDLFETKLISDEGMKKHRLIGQVFDTYWLIQMEDKLFILDQHAAHEKVLFERKMKELKERKHTSQMISPPVMITVTAREEMLLNAYMNEFAELGYEISSFGGKEYAVTAVPADLYGLDIKALFTELLGEMEEELSDKKPDMILDKLASMSCKAAVKGNHVMSFEEADHLIAELLTLDNPYACPHGRPTLISLTRRELEKKFKRIV